MLKAKLQVPDITSVLWLEGCFLCLNIKYKYYHYYYYFYYHYSCCCFIKWRTSRKVTQVIPINLRNHYFFPVIFIYKASMSVDYIKCSLYRLVWSRSIVIWQQRWQNSHSLCIYLQDACPSQHCIGDSSTETKPFLIDNINTLQSGTRSSVHP